MIAINSRSSKYSNVTKIDTKTRKKTSRNKQMLQKKRGREQSTLNEPQSKRSRLLPTKHTLTFQSMPNNEGKVRTQRLSFYPKTSRLEILQEACRQLYNRELPSDFMYQIVDNDGDVIVFEPHAIPEDVLLTLVLKNSFDHCHQQPSVYQIFVKAIHGRTLALSVRYDDTIWKVKHMIYEKENIPPEYQRLSWSVIARLDNRRTLRELGLTKDATLHLHVNFSPVY
jgi:hypothetical protein